MYQNSMPYVGGCRTSGGPCDPTRHTIISYLSNHYLQYYLQATICLFIYVQKVLFMLCTNPPLELFSSGNCQQNKITYLHYYCLVP